MEQNLISAQEFCGYHNIEYTFIDTLQDSGLITVVRVEQTPYIQSDDLEKLEKLVRLHFELEINVEGLETITHLLEKIERLQQEVWQLKNRTQHLSFLE